MTIGAHVANKSSLLASSLIFLAETHPEDHFIFFAAAALQALPPNCTPVSITPKPANTLLLYYWYNYRLPELLKKYNADIFISDAGLLSAKTTIPQYLYFSDDHFETGKSVYYKKVFKTALHRANKIFTTESFISDTLHKKYHVAPGKMQTVRYGVPQQARSNVSAQLIKEKFTEGYDYYICPVFVDTLPHLVVLLKAFSELKKWQKSSMKLVLLNEVKNADIIPGFKQYKYREDVKIISPSEKNADGLLPNAYAMVWLSGYTTGNLALHAFANHIPLIAADNAVNRSLFGDAALYAAVSEAGLAEKMQAVYKDEVLKKLVAENGHTLIKKYDASLAAQALWNGVTDNISVLPLKKIPSA